MRVNGFDQFVEIKVCKIDFFEKIRKKIFLRRFLLRNFFREDFFQEDPFGCGTHRIMKIKI